MENNVPACNGCWSTGSNACQFCKTYKLDDMCLESCDRSFVNNRWLYLSNNETRECEYCNDECKLGCRGGSTNFDCYACKNYKLQVNATHFKCLSACPITHYKDESTMTCFPCFKDCYGCTGPSMTIEQNGCTKCSSALVENDAQFSITLSLIHI